MDLKAKLLQARDVATMKVDLGDDVVVTVRALTRAEVMAVRDACRHPVTGKIDEAQLDLRTIAASMADPQLTFEEVDAWQKIAPAGDFAAVLEASAKLSKIDAGAAKSRLA